ncbi:hypothetical protein E2C01_095812 [Portunus trituberculatus]|uniref:Secreted protein n=1 Tax=Portunus trituberculatus TaxID=210409 RepID=A0A5B7K0D7_PORTR|nr:hypothetical protein [Portunus trituberculatus]
MLLPVLYFCAIVLATSRRKRRTDEPLLPEGRLFREERASVTRCWRQGGSGRQRRRWGSGKRKGEGVWRLEARVW